MSKSSELKSDNKTTILTFKNESLIDPNSKSKIYDLLFELRYYFMKEINRFVKNYDKDLDIFLKNTNPTDPLNIETRLHSQLSSRQDIIEKIDVSFKAKQNYLSYMNYIIIVVIISMNPVMYSYLPRQMQSSKLGLLYLIPIIFNWIFFAMPLLDIEHSLSQLVQGDILKVFCSLNPRALGIGISTILCIIYAAMVELFWSAKNLLYFIKSIRFNLQWAITPEIEEACNHLSSNLTECIVATHCIPNKEKTACVPSMFKIAQSFYYKTLLGQSLSNDLPIFNLYIFLAIIFSLLIVSFVVYEETTLIFRAPSITLAVTTITVCIFFVVQYKKLYLFSAIATSFKKFADKAAWKLLFTTNEPWLISMMVCTSVAGLVKGSQYLIASYTPIGMNIVHSGSAHGLIVLFFIIFWNSIYEEILITRAPEIDSIGFDNYFQEFTAFSSIHFALPIFTDCVTPYGFILVLSAFLSFYLQSIIRLSIYTLSITMFFENSYLAIRRIYCVIIAISLILIISVHYFLNIIPSFNVITIWNMFSYLMICCVIPWLGFFQVLTINFTNGWQTYTNLIGLKATYVYLAINLLLPIIVSVVFAHLLRRFLVFGFQVYLLCIVPINVLMKKFLSKKKTSSKNIFSFTTLGSYENLKNLINNVQGNKASIRRSLTILWVFQMNFFVPIVFVMVAFSNIMPMYFNTLVVYSLIIAILCILMIPILLGIIFPKLNNIILPSSNIKWSFFELSTKLSKTGTILHRKPLYWYEEFMQNRLILRNAYSLSYSEKHSF